MNFKINKKTLLYDSKPFIIAEIGSNFNQNKSLALQMIDQASKCGADAVKFQLFKAENLYSKSNPLYKIFKKIELNSLWLKDLSSYAKSKKIIFLASAFDIESVDNLEKINIAAYKIASSEITNNELLRYIAAKNKPIIISTGMADNIDIQYAIDICEYSNNSNIALLQCSALYPCSLKDANLNVISQLKNRFNKIVGFSDHTLDYLAASVAVGIGATIFEKHFTLNKKSEGPDHFYALEPKELKEYIKIIKSAYIAKGSHNKSFLDPERMVGRREGLYASQNLKKNDILKNNDFYLARPAIGIDSKFSNSVINSKVKTNIKKNQPIKWKFIA